ncbi:MAG: thioesterase family protein [Rhizomicrobium sp.]
MGNLADDTFVTEAGGRLSAALSRDWEIWGPNGGYVSAIALRAAGRVAPPDHRPATYSGQYLSVGQFAPVDIEAEAVRKGRNAWCVNVALYQQGKRFLQAQVWTTNKSDGPVKIERRMPDVPAPDDLKSWPELEPLPPGEKPFAFWDNFEGKPARYFGRGNPDPAGSILQAWHRYIDFPQEPDPFLDSARSLVLIDTLQWPAFNRGLSERPSYIAPSLDVTAWFLDLPGRSRWLFANGHADSARAGLIHGGVDIWSEDRRLIASGGSNMLHVARR